MMAKQRVSGSSDNKDLLRRMSANSDGIVERAVRFTNNDAPDYIRNLRRFEQESRKVNITISPR